LNVTINIATSDVFLPAFVAQEAKQDSWLAVIIGIICSFAFVNIIITLGLRYPKKTIVQYCTDILGKPLGTLIALLYTTQFLNITYNVTGQLSEIFVISFNPTAPLPFYSIVLIIVSAYAVKKGLEVIVRVNDIMLPVGLLVILFITVINIPKMDMKHFLPIMYEGITPSLKGGFLITGYLLESFIILQLIPFVKDKENIRKYINLSILLVGLGLLIGVLVIAVLGITLTQKMLFPALEFVRVAEIVPQITNLDISIMVVWISGIFVKITLYYYNAVLSIAQVFKFKTYYNMIMPTGLYIIALSVYGAKNIANVIHFLHYTVPIMMFLPGFIIPSIFLIISYIRDKLSDSSLAAQNNNRNSI
jgi:spore germination protein KB